MEERKFTSTDFADFGSREREMARELLNAWNEQGLPEDFEDDNVRIMMNFSSGCVFLTNDDYQVAMMNGNKLESFYTLPYEGEEGFAEDFEDAKEEDYNTEDWAYIKEVILKEE